MFRILQITHSRDDFRFVISCLDRKDYAVRPATSGRLGLAQIKKTQPDLILIDETVLEQEGYMMSRLAKNSAGDGAVAIIGTMENPQPQKLGVDGYLTKPIERHTLMALIDHVKRERELAERELRLRELEKELTAIETDLASNAEQQANLAAVDAHTRTPPDTLPPFVLQNIKDSYEGAAFSSHDESPTQTQEFASPDWTFFKAVEPDLSRCLESQEYLSVLLLEVRPELEDEDFDVEGFQAAVRRRISRLQQPIRRLVRLSTDHYCAILPKIDESSAVECAKAIIQSVLAAPFDVGTEDIDAKIQVGVATHPPFDHNSPFQLVDWAMRSLRHAKSQQAAGVWSALQRTT